MRAPGTPNGQATNRAEVRLERPRYPQATPSPATYNSPTTPTGTGRSHPSRTNSAEVDTGAPMGAAPDPAASGALIDA
ncbi:Uncharacterised protein [Mycobacteroides abscessus subsp. abscessus]|nr:Uncharacterised protein [Mycobacteroides abscessus subsp. abscessus]